MIIAMLSLFGDDWIKMATKRFFPINGSIVVGLLKSTFDCPIFFPKSIYAYFTITGQCGGYPTELFTIHIFTLAFNFCNGILCEIGFHLFINLQNNTLFFILQWRTGISIFTTATFAFAKVANKLLFHYILADQYVINHYHINQF